MTGVGIDPITLDLIENALPARLLQARDELSPEQIDSRMKQAPLVRDLLFLAREVVDQLLEIVVGEVREVGERFHWPPFGSSVTFPIAKFFA